MEHLIIRYGFDCGPGRNWLLSGCCGTAPELDACMKLGVSCVLYDSSGEQVRCLVDHTTSLMMEYYQHKEDKKTEPFTSFRMKKVRFPIGIPKEDRQCQSDICVQPVSSAVDIEIKPKPLVKSSDDEKTEDEKAPAKIPIPIQVMDLTGSEDDMQSPEIETIAMTQQEEEEEQVDLVPSIPAESEEDMFQFFSQVS